MSNKAISPTLQTRPVDEYTEDQVIQDYSNGLQEPDASQINNSYNDPYNQQPYGYSEANGYHEYPGYNGYQEAPENPRYPENEQNADYNNSPRYENEVEPQYGYDQTYQNGYSNGYQPGYDGNYSNYQERNQPITSYPEVVQRTSMDELKDVVNGLDGSFVQDEFGKIDTPGGLFKIIPLETQLSTTYEWNIPMESLKEEKLVSLPFGPREWSWQIILYPQGTGEALGQSMSAFLRPLKNEFENANENWTRPISKFIFSLKKNLDFQSSYAAEVDENYAIQYSQDDFKEFSQTVNGWGFQDFCPLPLNESDICGPSNTIRIVAQVYGPLMLKASTILYEQPVMLPLQVGQELITNAFGPTSCQWEVRVSPVVDEFGAIACLSGYLYPVKSKFELSLGKEWDRVISTFTLKLVDSDSQQTICSKSVSGGFIFSETSPYSGWDSLLSYGDAQTANAVVLHAEVTWDPNSLNENTVVGKLKAALQHSNEERFQDQQRAQYLEGELLKSAETEQSLSQYIQKLNAQLNEQQILITKNQLAREELDNLRQRVTLLTTELEDARNEQISFHATNVRLSTAKARIAEIRTKMDNDDIQPPVITGDIHSELAQYKAQLAQIFHEKAQVDLKLSQSLSELHFVQRNKKDEVLLAPIQNHELLIQAEDSVDPQQKILDALDNSRTEIIAGKAVLEEIEAKTAAIQLNRMTKAEKVGLVAEISMIQCQLDVAAATMYELQDEYLVNSPNEEFDSVLQELERVRGAMTLTRESIEKDLPLKNFLVASETSTAGISAPPIVPSVNQPKSRKSQQNNDTNRVSLSGPLVTGAIQPQFEMFTGKLDSVVDLIKNSLSTPRESVINSQKFELQIESWPPREDSDSKLDAVELQMLLKELKRSKSQKVLSWVSFLAIIGTIYFALYSTIFIVCNPSHPQKSSFERYQPLCTSLVTPMWETVKDTWHQSCEKIALEVLPSYIKKFTIGAKRIQGIKVESSTIAENIHPKDHNVPKTDVPTGAAINPSDAATFSHNFGESVEELYPAVIPVVEVADVEVDLTTTSYPRAKGRKATSSTTPQAAVRTAVKSESSPIPPIESNPDDTKSLIKKTQDKLTENDDVPKVAVTSQTSSAIEPTTETVQSHSSPEITPIVNSNRIEKMADPEISSKIDEKLHINASMITEANTLDMSTKETQTVEEEAVFTILPFGNMTENLSDEQSLSKDDSLIHTQTVNSQIQSDLQESNNSSSVSDSTAIEENRDNSKDDRTAANSKDKIQENGIQTSDSKALNSTNKVNTGQSLPSDELNQSQQMVKQKTNSSEILDAKPTIVEGYQKDETQEDSMDQLDSDQVEAIQTEETVVRESNINLDDGNVRDGNVWDGNVQDESDQEKPLVKEVSDLSEKLFEQDSKVQIEEDQAMLKIDDAVETKTISNSQSLGKEETKTSESKPTDVEYQEVSHSENVILNSTDEEERIKPSYDELIPDEELSDDEKVEQKISDEEEIITATEQKELESPRNKLKKFNQ
ncbi:hypothetical protein HDV04_004401 [Boothiomyces sp. JEL0838]|nr:hypothetical protein HDV04_004401 [Boothiomyces sp. JEL0838]